MNEIVALEYREHKWSSVAALAGRVAVVADGCVRRGLGAVGVAGLLSARLTPLRGARLPAVVFGFRVHTLEGLMAVAGEVSARGFSGLFTWSAEADDDLFAIDDGLLAGLGLLRAHGGEMVLARKSPAFVRRMLDTGSPGLSDRRPRLWMPAPDRDGRAVDGLLLEEAARRNVDLVWFPGRGINRPSAAGGPDAGITTINARHDDGTRSAASVVSWAAGDRLERGKIRVSDAAAAPGRWLREVIGWR